MINGRRPSQFTSEQLRWLCGVSVGQFAALAAELGPVWEAERHEVLSARSRKRAVGAGRRHEMPFVTRLFVCLVYLRWNIGYRALGSMVGFSKDTVNRAVDECTKLLAAKGITRPDGSQVADLAQLEEALAAVGYRAMADGTFVPVPRPGGGWAAQKAKFSGHRRRHCHTTQVVTDLDGHLLWVTDDEPGPTHDLAGLVFSGVADMIRDGGGTLIADRGYQGIGDHVKGIDVLLPDSTLGRGAGTYNTAHASLRVRVEHRNSDLKRRKILNGFRRNLDRLSETLMAVACLATLPKPDCQT